MGFRRKQWEKIEKKKKQYKENKKQGKGHSRYTNKEDYLPSKTADNRFVCIIKGKSKYLYPTLKKALLACKYAPDPQRPYYCRACKGYHTTSITKEEYYKRADDNYRKRYGEEPLHSRLPDLVKDPDAIIRFEKPKKTK